MTCQINRNELASIMHLSTIRLSSSETAVAYWNGPDYASARVSLAHKDVGAVLEETGDFSKFRNETDSVSLSQLGITNPNFAPPVLKPSKIICLGLNFRTHILEMGRDLPSYPTLFAKFPETLIGADDQIIVDSQLGGSLDWEGELGFVIGRQCRNVAPLEAEAMIAGYFVANDVTVRQYQYRTSQWLSGKAVEGTTPCGPWIAAGVEDIMDRHIVTRVNGVEVQRGALSDMVFSPGFIVSYVSQIVSLRPGDMILMGTPGGVGHARSPQQYLMDGNVLETEITGLGRLRNRVKIASVSSL